MRVVTIESPFAGDVEKNVGYAKAAVRDCLARGEAPYASHLFFTQSDLLDDDVPEERRLGIQAGFEWASRGEARVVYVDRGISRGMREGIEHARQIGQIVEFRSISGWQQKTFLDQCRDGVLLPEDIDDFVEAWHNRLPGAEGVYGDGLHVYLGMHPLEYGKWVADPDYLQVLLGR